MALESILKDSESTSIHVLRFGRPCMVSKIFTENMAAESPEWGNRQAWMELPPTLFFPSHANSSKWFTLAEAELLIWKMGIIITS